MNFIAIIPARYASTRFPGKPLAMLGEKSVIQRVYEQVTKQLPACVATDDERIYEHVKSFGGHAVMTRTDHKSGTDRIEEAVEKLQLAKEFEIDDNNIPLLSTCRVMSHLSSQSRYRLCANASMTLPPTSLLWA